MNTFNPSDMTDFDLDDYIADHLSMSPRELGNRDELLLRAVHEEWKGRHPDTLPPCFSQVSFPECYTGTRNIFQWPEA